MMKSKKLSEVKWEDLKLNDKVISDKTGEKGHIVALDSLEEHPMDEDNMVTIDWNNGSVSYIVWQYWLDKVTYIGRKGFNGT